MERFFLLDGMAIAYRAYFAFISRPLINSKGMNTSAIVGFVSTLDKILSEERPEHIAVAFDTPTPTFRHVRYPAYKATREKMPDDMVEQLPWLKRIVQAYNIPMLELPGWEADDVIGTLAHRAESEHMLCCLVTPDKDYMQLVTDRVRLYRPGKRADAWDVIDAVGVHEKFGVRPDQVIDVLGLMGDQSDNIPGVKGIGEKTAIPLIQEFGSIPALYENLDRVAKPSIRARLDAQRDMAFLSRELVTIDCNAPIAVDPMDLRASPKNVALLRDMFTELELTRFLSRLRHEGAEAAAPGMQANDESQQRETSSAASPGSLFDDESLAGSLRTAATSPHEYHLVRHADDLRSMVSEIAACEEFCVDTETTSTSALTSTLVGLSFAVRPGHAWYVAVTPELPAAVIADMIAPLFTGSHRLVGQNLKFDLTVLAGIGVSTRQPLYDTMLSSYILRPDGAHDMDALAVQLLGYRPIPISSLIGSGRDQRTMADVPVEDVAEYAAEDADITLQIAHALRPEIVATGQQALLEEVEFPLVHVLVDMERTGIRVDVNALGEISKEMAGHIESVIERIHVIAGETFNIASTKQLGAILFDKLGLPSGKKTKTGYSTDVSVLESLVGVHPIVEDVLLYRQLTKLKSTYVDALPRMVNPHTGRVHSSFNQAVAATGRLSSTDPNLQNIPIRTEAGREIRRAFVPEEPFALLSADYSQIELRLAAELSGDEGLMAAFTSREDIHTSTAMRLFSVASGDVTADMRRRAKTVNFGILYGISAFGLAQRLGIPNADAKDLIDLYFEKYPRINRYISETLSFAKVNGYVQTLKGRRRYLPDINNKNRTVRMFAERVAINAPIQGSAADMIKIAMIRVDKELHTRGLLSRLLLQVHDELVFEVAPEETDEVRELVTECMVNALDLRVPIVVETGIGSNWLEAH